MFDVLSGLSGKDTSWVKLVHTTFALNSNMTIGQVYDRMSKRKDGFAAIVEGGVPVGVCSRGALGFVMGSLYGHSVWSRKPITSKMLDSFLIIKDGTRYEDGLLIALSRPSEFFHDDVVITDKSGQFVGLVAVTMLVAIQSALLAQKTRHLEEDLAHRNQIEEDLRLANQKLETAKVSAESASAAKSSFLANMSHELRTPLNAVIGYSEMLQDVASDNGHDDYIADLKKIRSAGKHLLELINAVLDLSKVEAGKMELYIENFSIRHLIEEVLLLVEPVVAKNKNVVVLTCDPELKNISADATKVRQSLFNLMSNAAKFTHEGTITVSAEIKHEDGREWIVVDVKDTGIGISPEQVEKLFQPFQQADSSTTRKYGGTGLGLTISRQFCRLMGGDLGVKSSCAGGGTTFSMRLPISAKALPSGRTKVLSRCNALKTSKLNHRIVPSIKVLVIDDDPATHDILDRCLAILGCETHFSGDGESGLRMASSLRPDIIILDVMMPQMDGWCVLNALKKDKDLGPIPVIMFTMMPDRNMGYALGASDYLMKPLDQQQLRKCIDKYHVEKMLDSMLIVDDDPAVLERLSFQLRREGIEPLMATNGIEALKVLAERKVSLILTDLMMPEMDGFALIYTIQNTPAWRNIPIIVMSARELSPEELSYLNSAAKGVLQKHSIPYSELFTYIGNVISVQTGITPPALTAC